MFSIDTSSHLMDVFGLNTSLTFSVLLTFPASGGIIGQFGGRAKGQGGVWGTGCSDEPIGGHWTGGLATGAKNRGSSTRKAVKG